ncbi:hypothetical protein LJB96_04525 [Methanobrevibacter sp. OttesenSCG-928-K11]|nr:hypothetical protein [Methanobrevibacter sp. OttesenSCG-928-K11]MDL2270341.1 hypothetical protein [Methanobrevibacter sp. OttesenSCG-928-I08]
MRPRNDGKIIILLIATLVAFGIGSGFGISMGLSGDDPLAQNDINQTKIPINVTKNISAYENHSKDTYDPYLDGVQQYNDSNVKYIPQEEFGSENFTYNG